MFLVNSFGQGNDYFGSAIIPRNEYIIKLAGNNSYLNISAKASEVKVSEVNAPANQKFMFIPAGEGFYFIKYQANGQYLSINQATGKSAYLQISEPVRNNSQKFKVISIGNNQFKFLTADNHAIEFDAGEKKLRTGTYNGGKHQAFEILEANSMKKL